jgi:flagellar basal-body rod protein FlgB
MSWSQISNFPIAQKSLDALWLRQQAISNNIANADTPGYRSKSVEFENILTNKLNSLGSNENINDAVQTIDPQIVEDDTTAPNANNNNVNIDSQNIELVRTQLQYEYMTKMISDEISRQKYAITEGRR